MASREQTIVVAEDDASIADLLDLYLRDAGYRPLRANEPSSSSPSIVPCSS